MKYWNDMKHIKTYMGVCFGSLLMTLSSCEPNMDYNNPLAENEATYYNTKEEKCIIVFFDH